MRRNSPAICRTGCGASGRHRPRCWWRWRGAERRGFPGRLTRRFPGGRPPCITPPGAPFPGRNGGEHDMARRAWHWLAAAALALGFGAAAQAQTLAAVKQRGTLNCGISQGFAGFSAPDSRGEYRGLDADYCRALAAAVLGDATKVRFVPLTAQARFTALQTGEIDVLYRNSTQTFLRDASLGLNQGPVNFYDGQGFAVRRDSNVTKVAELDGATICVAQGTTHELNLGDVFRARNIKFSPVVFERVDTMYDAFFSGRCDAMTQDASALAGALTVARDPAAYKVLEETISKEPLGP